MRQHRQDGLWGGSDKSRVTESHKNESPSSPVASQEHKRSSIIDFSLFQLFKNHLSAITESCQNSVTAIIN